jgi:hypothetical protein
MGEVFGQVYISAGSCGINTMYRIVYGKLTACNINDRW